MTLSFNIWFFNKKHKHHHSAMIINGFWGGIVMTFIGIAGISISAIFALAFFLLSGVSLTSGFYYIIDKRRKNAVKKETNPKCARKR